MAYRIEFGREAMQELKKLRKGEQAEVLIRCRTHLTHEPKKESKSRIKRLRDDAFPPYRLRIGDLRVFYDVDDGFGVVIIHGVVRKMEAQAWLEASIRRRRTGDESH
ncbi:MAG: type II toxin-antitoxin system RelE/ParE family toxin [Planctomycetota bacterium]|nr:type II toxin-antitoxin system RelE/ParE family toxin [Planctomycetota bacterium]